jgi:hypothetical protein
MGSGLFACAAGTDPHEYEDEEGDGDGGGDPSGGNGGGGAGGPGTGVSGSSSTGSGSASSGSGMPTALTCPPLAQEILILDFRSGWWSGGGGGDFAKTPLQAIAQTCADTSVEYHHFENDFRVKCLYETNGGTGCETISWTPPETPEEITAIFEKPAWNDYTQIWILSGSDLDATDVSLTGALFDHFLKETNGSCIPVLIGAGDGFITHGNAVAGELGLGQVFSTEFTTPGFFSVAFDLAVNVDSRMFAGAELEDHFLFEDVDSIADTVSNNSGQATHGDTIADVPGLYNVIAHDTSGRAAIAIGSISLEGDTERPFIIDSGFQRYYGISPGEGTQKLLENTVKYLGSVGCRAEPPK